MLDRLDHDDGVIDHQADGQHQAEQGQGVDGEAEQGKEHERAHQRHRHGQQRNERGPPALEEQEHHQDDQHQGLEQGMLDLLDALGHRQGGVQADHVVEIRRKPLLQVLHQRLGAVGRLDRVGARHLVEGDQGAGFAVEPPFHAVGLGAEFDPGHVGHAHHRAVRVGAQHHPAEILGRLQPALGAHRVGELLARRHRLGAHLAGRVDRVLGVDRIDDLGDGDVEPGQPVRLDPHAHGVLAGAEDGHAGDARNPGHLVVDVDVAVVGEKDVVIGAVRRIEAEHDQRRGGGLLHLDAVVAHVAGQLGFGLALAHLHQQLVGVGVGLDVEIDRQLGLAVVGVDRVHVVHVVHARHLLLDGRGHGLL